MNRVPRQPLPGQGPPLDPSEAPQLRRFEVLRKIGSGNTGTIYHVRARVALGGLRPGDEAALKLLHPYLMDQEEARKAFLREARAGMQIRHPNLVRVHAVEEVVRGEERRRYLVLELVRGRSLREWLDQETLALEPTLRLIGRQIAGALAALHGAGILHLDVKPENIVWNEDRAVLMDLGFARRNPAAGAPAAGTAILESSGGGSDVLFVGTPAYAAPELLAGEKPTPAVDLFALGVTLYECSTGVRPFGDERRHGLFEARRRAVVRKPSTIQPRLSPFLDAVLLGLLAERPADRIGSAAELERIFAEGERSAWWRNFGETAPLLPILHPNALPFEGRDAELAVIRQTYQEAREGGRPQVIALSGAPSVGKSRLAMEAAAQLRRLPEAPPFLYGRCIRVGRGSAFRAVLDSLARSLGLTPGQLPNDSVQRRLRSGLSPGAAEVLIQLLQGRVYPRAVRRRAFLDWFRALGREGPFFVFFDDVQVTGASLWTFMEEVLALENTAAVFVVAHREDLRDRGAEARRALLRRANTREIRLAPLDDEAMGRILDRTFAPGALPDELREDLMEVSHGRPGALNDVLRLLRQRDQISGACGEMRPAGPAVSVPLTADQAELLRTELAEMNGNERDLLLWAAMLTPPLDLGLLMELAGLSEAQVTRRLRRLRDAGWLKIENGRYRFALPRLREAAYRYVAPRGQRRRHARVYEVLTRTRRDVPSRLAARAFHAHRAGLHAEAIQLGIPKVEVQVQTGAFEQAGQAVQALWKHVDSLGWEQLPPETRVRLLIARAHVAGFRGDREAEAADLRTAGQVAQESQDPALRARVHVGLARHARAMGFLAAARLHVQRARELLGRPMPPTPAAP